MDINEKSPVEAGLCNNFLFQFMQQKSCSLFRKVKEKKEETI